MNKAVVALGSNIEPEKHVSNALQAISDVFTIVKKSKFIYTRPVGYKDQPDFLNGTALIESIKNKPGIITILKQIEHDLGRQRGDRKDGPRRIDLDLIWYNSTIMDEDVYKRDFLKCSIQEILPELEFIPDMK